MTLVRVSGELMALGRNSAVRLLLQRHNAETYPRAYPQFKTLTARLKTLANGILAMILNRKEATTK